MTDDISTKTTLVDEESVVLNRNSNPTSRLGIARLQLLHTDTGEPIEDVDVVTSARAVVFDDKDTFQTKFNKGELQGARGEKGEPGTPGFQGDKGDKGDKGDPGEVTQVEFDEHLADYMPHIMTDLRTNKKYRFGYRVSSQGVPQVISEEVI